MPARRYSVYVIELSRKVFSENVKFRNANPQFNGVLECLYVGLTSKSPKERLQQHISGARSKKGVKISSHIVQKYGMYLRPSLYHDITQVSTKNEGLKNEEELALKLRKQGYAVWYN